MGSCIAGQIYCKDCFKMDPKTLQGEKEIWLTEKQGDGMPHIYACKIPVQHVLNF